LSRPRITSMQLSSQATRSLDGNKASISIAVSGQIFLSI
jgi:hypothetical protein